MAVRKKLLLVEDDEAIASIVAEIARGDDLDVAVAVNGNDALRQWRETRPDLMVIDLVLPGGIDGAAVLRQLRREFGAAPTAIMLSAATEADHVAEDLGVSIIRKPFDLDELLQLVRQKLGAP